MALTRELAVKIAHVSGETTTLKFSPLAESPFGEEMPNPGLFKKRLQEINTGTIANDFTAAIEEGEPPRWGPLPAAEPVAYQSQLLSKSGSPAASITAATYTETNSTRIYTRAAE